MNQHELLEQIAINTKETADRTRRTETNMHKIREHFGIAGPNGQITCTDHNTVKVHGFDVTLSQILKCLEGSEDFERGDKVRVRNGAGVIAVINFVR